MDERERIRRIVGSWFRLECKADSRAATMRRLLDENAELRRQLAIYKERLDTRDLLLSDAAGREQTLRHDANTPPVVLDKPDGPGWWWVRWQKNKTFRTTFDASDIADWDRGSYRESFRGCQFQRVQPPVWPEAKKETNNG